MSSAALSSDHVNYLILRYLQEAGHENAAIAFYRDWHRQPQFRDPEDYPFAPVVRRGELVHVIQDGLHHDELTARVKKTDRQFQFTNADASRGMLDGRERDGALENGAGASRPSSSGAKRKVRPPVVRPPDEFPTPAPKRQRRSEGSEGLHVNGEPMDVDAASPSADPDDDAEAASPAVASETEIVEIPERYDSVHVGVQTDVKTGPKTTTMYVKVDKPEAMIYHAAFNPDLEPANGGTLFTVGDSLCRFYQVPDRFDDVRQIMSVDEPSLPPNSVVTASAWHPQGHTATCAVNSSYQLPDGRQRDEKRLVSHGTHGRTHLNFLLPPLMEPAGIILLLRYSPEGKYLLVISTNTKRGLAVVYDASAQAADRRPIAWRFCEHQTLSASWIGETAFILCGDQGLAESFALDETPMNWENGFSQETIPMVGLTKLQTSMPEADYRWDKVAYDASQQVVALASTENGRLTIGACAAQEDGKIGVKFQGDIELPAQLTAVAFQPHSQADAQHPFLLAAAFEDGSCRFYTRKGNEDASLTCVISYHLNEGPALALAWSQGGQYLAISGTELVQIWDIGALIQLENGNGKKTWIERRNSLHESLITWRPDASVTKQYRNGEHGHEDEQQSLSEPSLSWNANGEMLAFAVNKQVCSFITQLSASIPASPLLMKPSDRCDLVPAFAVWEAVCDER